MRILSALLALVVLASTGWTYSTDAPSKTVTSDGSLLDTTAARNYIVSQAEDGWTLVIGEAGGSYTWLQATQSYQDFTFTHTTTVRGASPTNRPRITQGPVCVLGYATGKLVTVKDIIFVFGEARNGPYHSVAGSGPEPGFRYTNIKWEGNWPGPLFEIGTGGGNPGTREEGPFGLVDNCTSDYDISFVVYCNNGGDDARTVSPSWRRPIEWGSTKAVYFEDNEFRNASGVISGAGVVDAYSGGSYVFRRNIVENMLLADHGTDHYSQAVKGVLKHEIYDNDFYTSSGNSSWMTFFRGGTAAIFDNRFHATGTGSSQLGIYWDFYRANAGAGPANSIYDRFYGDLSTTIAAGSNGQSLPQRTVHVASTAGLIPGYTADIVGPVYTTIAAGSNGATLPQGTIHVADTSEAPASGHLRIGTPQWVGEYGDYAQLSYTGKTSTTFTGCTVVSGARTMATGDTVAVADVTSKFAIYIENIKITTSNGVQTVRATGRTATTFTGVFGGTGTMSTGAAVTRASDYMGTQQPGSGPIFAAIAAGSNGVSLPQSTINVDSTIQFPASGTLLVNYDWEDGTGQTVTYTGKTSTTFTGCSGGTGTMTTGNLVGGIGQDPRHPTEPWGSMPIWQWNNTTIGPVSAVTGKSVHDFIETDRDIFIEDDQLTKPTNTGTWLDEYAPLGDHPLNDTVAAVQKRARVGGKTIRIGGKVLRTGDN